MESGKPLVCNGGTCDKKYGCTIAERCLYKSSAEEAKEVISASSRPVPPYVVPDPKTGLLPLVTIVPELRLPPKIGDFDGKTDGGGLKQVMFEPKTAVQLIDPRFIEGIGDVLQYGANKYAANNWMRGMAWVTVIGGIFRHLLAFCRGEEIDPKDKGGSGLPHLYHAACGLMFLCHYAHSNREAHKSFDNRVFK